MIQAAKWYDQQSLGLGNQLLAEIGRSLRSVLDFPLAHPETASPFRRVLLDTFPYGLIYRIEPAEIVVIAVANLKRRPGYWRRRARA